VCDNSQEALNDTLLQVLSDGTALRKLRAKLRQKQPDNEQAQTQFLNLIEG
jgi:hypothetical protein